MVHLGIAPRLHGRGVGFHHQLRHQIPHGAGGVRTKMRKESQNRARLLASMISHGATQVEIGELFKEAQVIWQIKPDEEVSETCVQLEEFTASAARNAQSALQVIDRMGGSANLQDRDLLTALKKYVEDVCEAIKIVDNSLKDNGSSLEALLFEIPNETLDDEASRRNLIGRRDVIAHKLLTVDDDRVYKEAVRDFGSLHQLLSKVYFVPVKTDWTSGDGFSPLVKTHAVRNLAPSGYGQTPHIGESLIFICEDKVEGFMAFRLGRTDDNKFLVGASHAPRSIHISVYGIKVHNEVRGAGGVREYAKG